MVPTDPDQRDEAALARTPPGPSRQRPPPTLSLQLAADAVTLSVVRQRLARWLGEHGWPPGQCDDVVMAVNEAVSNSVEHGYGVGTEAVGHPGLIEVTGVILPAGDGHKRVECVVRDHGKWRPPPEDDENRRRGFVMMGACMESVKVDGTDMGTTVALLSWPVPLPPRDQR